MIEYWAALEVYVGRVMIWVLVALVVMWSLGMIRFKWSDEDDSRE